jgi:hypothetical protein
MGYKEQKAQDLSTVNEAIGVYVRRINKSSRQKIDEDVTYSGFFKNKMLIIRAIRRGLPYKLFD